LPDRKNFASRLAVACQEKRLTILTIAHEVILPVLDLVGLHAASELLTGYMRQLTSDCSKKTSEPLPASA